MRVSFESQGDFKNLERWLKNIEQSNVKDVAQKIAREGVQNLKNNTPKDTGKTSEGWYSEVKLGKDILEIAWMNNANPDEEVNIAKLIEFGHGTRTGGYVPPQPFIKQSMDSIFKKAGDDFTRGLIK